MKLKINNINLNFNKGKGSIINSHPDIEIERIKLLREIERDAKRKFNLPNTFLLSDLYIYSDKKNNDPVMCKLETEIEDEKKLYKFLNKRTKEAIILLKKINTTRFDNSKINKKTKKTVFVLTYNNETIIIKKNQYYRIKKLIIDKTFEKYFTFDTLIWMLFYRYDRLHLYNNSQGAVHPKYYTEFSNKYKTNVEAFGSFFNHTLKYYFGLYPDLEKYFGCLGNFYLASFNKGVFIVNPPFTVIAINKTIDFMLMQLSKATKNLTFLFVIPTWSNEDRGKLNKICKMKLKPKYDRNVRLDLLLKSNYITQYLLYCKENFTYYDYIKMQDCQFAPSTLITLSNNKKILDIENIFGKEDVKII